MIVGGDINADFEQPRDEREAAIAAALFQLLAHWGAMRARSRTPHAPWPARRAVSRFRGHPRRAYRRLEVAS
eukprot:150091-Lingulodinium_polyedra.AAC.1